MRDRSHDDRDEADVARVLGEAPRLERMLDSERGPILAALLRESGDRPARSGGTRWPAWKRRAAAAAILLAALLLFASWPGLGGADVAWADVVERARAVGTFSATIESRVTDPSGEVVRVSMAKVYVSDAGVVRSEDYEDVGDAWPPPPRWGWGFVKADTITITRDVDGARHEVTFHPYQKVAQRRVLESPEGESDAALATELWQQLAGIAADDTLSIGSRRLGWRRVVGFSTNLAGFQAPLETDARGTVRIWVDAKTAVPVAVEMDIVQASGTQVEILQRDLRWNEPLDADLFDTTTPDGWRDVRHVDREVQFASTTLRPGVTFRIMDPQRKPIVTEQDVASIPGGMMRASDGRQPSPWVTVILTPDGAERLAEHTSRHVGDQIRTELDGALVSEATIASRIEGSMMLSVRRIVSDLDEFESAYLVSSP